MTFEEQLIKTLDGTAADVDQEEVLSQLAVSPEKRSVFHQHLRLREVLGRDAAGLRPSRSQRNAVIASLLAVAGAPLVGAGSRSLWSRTPAGLRNAALAVSGVALGGLIMYGLLAPKPATNAPQTTVAPIVQQQTDQTGSAQSLPTVPSNSPFAQPQVVRVAVPETTFVTAPPVVVHDIVRDTVYLPLGNVAAGGAATRTVIRDTVYLPTPAK